MQSGCRPHPPPPRATFVPMRSGRGDFGKHVSDGVGLLDTGDLPQRAHLPVDTEPVCVCVFGLDKDVCAREREGGEGKEGGSLPDWETRARERERESGRPRMQETTPMSAVMWPGWKKEIPILQGDEAEVWNAEDETHAQKCTSSPRKLLRPLAFAVLLFKKQRKNESLHTMM